MDDFGDDLDIQMNRMRNSTRQRAGRSNSQNASSLIVDYESDTDMDSELSTIDEEEDEGMDSSDTSDDDIWYNDGNLSAASSDSSLADSYIGEGASSDFFELMSQHLEMFNHDADSFFRVSLRTLYETLMEFMEEKVGPTPTNILQSLPSVKVTLAQIASNATCAICFAEYEQDEELIKLPCNHDYHKECIHNWLKLKSTCPTCRLDLVKPENSAGVGDSSSRVRNDNNMAVEDIDISDIDSLLITNNTATPDDNEGGEGGNTTSTSNNLLNDSRASSTNSILSTTTDNSTNQSSPSTSSSITSLASTNSSASSSSTGSNSSSSGSECTNELRLFSRSSSPLTIDSNSSDDATSSIYSSKVSVVSLTTSEEEEEEESSSKSTSTCSPQNNKRQINSNTVIKHLPAKRKTMETEIW